MGLRLLPLPLSAKLRIRLAAQHTVRRARCLPLSKSVCVWIRIRTLCVCVCMRVPCKQKTLVCQFELENFCVEISQKWVVNVESAWYAVDNFQMAAICKAIWKRNGNMRNNLHSGAIFTSTLVAFALVFWLLFSFFFEHFLFFLFFFFFCHDNSSVASAGLSRALLACFGPAMFVCFGYKQLSVISDKLIWQSTGDQHDGWQHCQGAGRDGRQKRRRKQQVRRVC